MATFKTLVGFILLSVLAVSLLAELAPSTADRQAGSAAMFVAQSPSSHAPAADDCDHGFCHFSHCAHMALTASETFEPSPELAIVSLPPYRFELTMPSLASIFRPPIA